VGLRGGARPGVHLSWVRENSAAECPDAAAIETEVTERLGDNPFRRQPTQFIEAIVARQATAFEVTIAMRDESGRLIGNRSLSSTSEDCRSISTAAALIIAILIDPQVLTRAPPPSEGASTPAIPVSRDIGARLALQAEAAWGTLPRVAFGVGFAGTVDLARRAALGFTAVFLPEVRAGSPNEGFAFGQSSGELVGCFVATDPPAGGPRWELCGGVGLGLLHVVVSTSTPINPGQRWSVAAAQVTRLILPFARQAVVELSAGIEEPFTRRSFFIEQLSPAMNTVFRQPAVAATASAGLGLRWR
jgi:hypothetical protein